MAEIDSDILQRNVRRDLSFTGMTGASFPYASQLRLELGLRNRMYTRNRAHVESYRKFPIVIYAPNKNQHKNFFKPAYNAIAARPEWLKRFDKIHSQGRSLPKPTLNPTQH